jgi:hypothetical protein
MSLTAPLIFDLAAFAATILSASLFSLTAAGHFPSRNRLAHMRTPFAVAVLWGTILVSAVATVVAIIAAGRSLPWAYAVVAGSLAILFAPLVLQKFSDSFVDGPIGLLAFASMAVVLAAITGWYSG